MADTTTRVRLAAALTAAAAAGAAGPPLEWCVVMSDTRRLLSTPGRGPPEGALADGAAANRAWALAHGYGFANVRLAQRGRVPACAHRAHGPRFAAWCKVPAVAHVLLRGVSGRRCRGALYLDADAHVANASMAAAAYLARARAVGDEAVQDDGWHFLLPTNAPTTNDTGCTGVWWVRNSAEGRGVLRSWWDASWPTRAQRHPFEQKALAWGGYRFNRPFGDALRLLVTANHFGPLFADAARAPADPFITHLGRALVPTAAGKRRAAAARAAAEAALAALGPARAAAGLPPGAAETLVLARENASAPFEGGALLPTGERAVCAPFPRLRPEAAGWDDERRCCESARKLPLRPSRTRLDGSALPDGAPDRPCWAPSDKKGEKWTCWDAWRRALRAPSPSASSA